MNDITSGPARLPRRSITAMAVAAGFLTVSNCFAVVPIVTLTMDDLPNQPVDGLVHPLGVTFGFTVDGVADLDAEYNSSGPGTTVFVEDPSIEGTSAGVLSIEFENPTALVAFGVAANRMGAVPEGAVVTLFEDGGGLLLTESMTLEPLATPFGGTGGGTAPIFPEGRFEYLGGAPVKSLTIDFSAPMPTSRFALDNLSFFAVPEPTGLLLFAVLAAFTLRRGH